MNKPWYFISGGSWRWPYVVQDTGMIYGPEEASNGDRLQGFRGGRVA